MELHIAGGCGEHGRNCFHILGKNTNFIVDCGVSAAEQDRYPRLPIQEISQIQTVFLTHSHADHTGALPWLYQNGFCGEVIASKHTLQQLPFKLNKATSLESICSPGSSGLLRDIRIFWGRSGHCLGSVWFRFEVEGKTILFSGDYTENSPVYCVDFIRGQQAELAVLDCAYGNSTTKYEEACTTILSTMEQLLQKYNLVVLPVPKYGRGLDLLSLFLSRLMNISYYGDSHFLTQLSNIPLSPEWFLPNSQQLSNFVRPYHPGKKGILFVSDAQLRSCTAFQTALKAIQANGIAMMTGTVEKGTNSAALIDTGKMLTRRYPVHLNYAQYEELKRTNQFKITIPYHSAELACTQTVIAI